MQHETLRFGTIECADDATLCVPGGIAPFRDAERWVLLADDEEAPFAWLQSLDDPALAFVLAPLEALYPDSARRVLREGGEGDGEVGVFGIVVVNGDASLATVNLLAPLVLDFGAMQGRQVILEGPPQLARASLMGTAGCGEEPAPAHAPGELALAV